jgi:hypothetical protein
VASPGGLERDDMVLSSMQLAPAEDAKSYRKFTVGKSNPPVRHTSMDSVPCLIQLIEPRLVPRLLNLHLYDIHNLIVALSCF